MVNAESRRGGPSPHKTAQTRQAVARAALELFIEQGYRGTLMSDVAERAGTPKGPSTGISRTSRRCSPA